MATQQEIQDLLDDSLCASSTLNKTNQPPNEGDEDYGDEQFENFEQSKWTEGFSKSKPAPQSHTNVKSDRDKDRQQRVDHNQAMRQTPKLKGQQEQHPATNSISSKGLSLNPKSKAQTFSQTAKTGVMAGDRLHSTHNYGRLQERERQLLMTTMSEENKRLKEELAVKAGELKKTENKYNVLLGEKSHDNSTARQKVLEKKVQVLQAKVEKANNIRKIEEQKNKYKAKVSHCPQNFIPQELADERERALLSQVDQLKECLIRSDENLKTLQDKMNESVSYNDQLMGRMRRVEKLEYRIDKMTEQAQNDRGLISSLKQKIKELQGKLQAEKDRAVKLEVTVRRFQMGQETNAQILQELNQTREQKQQLEQSLRKLSSTMMEAIKTKKQPSDPRVEDIKQTVFI